MLLQHEVDYIAERLLDRIETRLIQMLRATMKEELAMTDQAITDLTAADDAILGELTLVVTDLQDTAAKLAAALAASGATQDAAIEAQVARLTAGTKAASDALAAMNAGPVASPVASPVDSPAPAAPDAPDAATA